MVNVSKCIIPVDAMAQFSLLKTNKQTSKQTNKQTQNNGGVGV